MKRKTKIVTAILALAIASTLVATGAVLTFYGNVETTANVKQSVVLSDGSGWQDYTTPVGDAFDVYGGCCECYTYHIKNRGCVEAPIEMDTIVDGPAGPEGGVSVEYYVDQWMEDASTYNQVDNVYDDDPENLEEPWFEYTFNADGTITIEFHNPTSWQAIFDYRVDEESGENHDWTGMEISEGPLAGTNWDQKFNWVVLSSGESDTVTVDPCYKLEITHQVGSEQMCYIPWVTIERPAFGPTFTLEAGEQIDFVTHYCFDIAVMPGIYDITTKFSPATD